MYSYLYISGLLVSDRVARRRRARHARCLDELELERLDRDRQHGRGPWKVRPGFPSHPGAARLPFAPCTGR
eukprot:SAG22_NODE_10282_length_543_cov_1.191441_1_plen_70_part_10